VQLAEQVGLTWNTYGTLLYIMRKW
jgi:hypothetical protein